MASKKRKMRLIVSDDKKPTIKVDAGTRMEVVAVEMIKPMGGKGPAIGARLCGGSGTCLALVDVD